MQAGVFLAQIQTATSSSREIRTAAALLLFAKQNRPPESGRYKIIS
jgi:hypothetical protein